MKAKKNNILQYFILLTFFACTGPKPDSASNNGKTVNVTVLDDFENKSSLNKWKGSVSISKELPAHGKTCCKLTATEGQPLWLETREFPEDWSAFEYMKFDVYNPSPRLYYGTIQIFDEQGTDEQAEFHGQSYFGEGKIFLNTGWNHFEFLIQHAMVEEGNRPLALNKIRKLRFSFGLTENPLYIDNIRLLAGKENSRTMSRIDHRDCMVVIDNRNVYSTLAGPIEKIKTSSEIIHLRDQATASVNKLRQEIGIAELQGFQTLYQRIPLITAEVGMGIRSKLVWFQSETEEKKILEYVISSCSKTVKEIHDMIAAHQSDVMTMEPENEVSPASFYVPPYPPLQDLKPVDGFYRDQSGRPVIIFSMLQINEGPLHDYFAPFNHRLESYTVGGGSRYNIESSPVYEAFHKYPGTRRIGWDGWCGHLIKDRWAMGGKKEDVVICLESPHIREAVLEYMKIHHREWTDNTDLLYNIMAYELQYICYCDRSQEMFREWLLSKYKTVNALNKTWNTDYRSFAEIRAPATHNARPVDDVNRAAWYDWSCFNARRFTDYMKWIKSEMRKFETKVPICAGGTSSMLSSSNSVTGIDEELIINEVDDVILNESGGSTIFSDLLLSLSEKKMLMVDPEMGGGTHGLLLQFLHGKSDISKWWWASFPSREYRQMNESSLPHSKEISLADIDEVLRIGLDVRRLAAEITEFTKPDPEIALLYSKSTVAQVPPQQIQAGLTPYLDAVYNVWEGTRFLGCRIGFVSEKQILAGKLSKFKLLIVPAVKYIPPEVVNAIKTYIEKGGTIVMIPESFCFDQYARENNSVSEFGITISGVTLPPVIGNAERKQNYDQSFSQAIIYGEVKKSIATVDKDIFANLKTSLQMSSDGLVQSIDQGTNQVLAKFDDGKAAIVLVHSGKGSLYYLAAPLKSADYHVFLSPLAQKLGITRPVQAVDPEGNLVTGAEIRAVEREKDYLVYVINLQAGPVEFDLKASSEIKAVFDMRSLKEIAGNHIKLGPWQETIFKVHK